MDASRFFPAREGARGFAESEMIEVGAEDDTLRAGRRSDLQSSKHVRARRSNRVKVDLPADP